MEVPGYGKDNAADHGNGKTEDSSRKWENRIQVRGSIGFPICVKASETPPLFSFYAHKRLQAAAYNSFTKHN